MLLQLISRARRRLLWNALASEAVRAAVVAVALLVFLLLLGTDILGWRWLVVMPAVALAAGAFLAVRHLPGVYDTARMIDGRLQLSDTLSTALFCAGPDSERFDRGMQQAQREHAEATARAVRVGEAVPFRTPRLVYAAVPLALIACSLFVLRYVWQDQLDLRQPVPLIAGYLERLSHLELSASIDRMLADPPHAKPSGRDGGKDQDSRAKGDRGQSSSRPSDAASQAEKREEGSSQTGAANREAEQQNGAQNAEKRESNSGNEQKQAGDTGREGAPSDANSSLMSKLSDAMRNMLSRLRSQSQAGQSGQQQARENSAGQKGGQQGQRSRGQQGSQQQADGKAAGQSSGQSQQASGRNGQQGANQSGSGRNGESDQKQPGSGAGSDNGAKDLKDAERLDAMGKLSVIFGKRSENLTGDTTVEAVSGKQTLVTPYSNRQAAHAQSMAAIGRDEVPVGLEDYVERYFTAVRSRTPRKR